DVRERKMADPSGALDETLRSFALAPDNAATRDEILRLARATGRWEEAIRVEGDLFGLAETLPEKLEIARNAADPVEHEVKDLEADVIEELAADLLKDTSGPQPAAAARPPAPPPLSRLPELQSDRVEDDKFATPWEELADAYDSLPAEDSDTRRVYLRKIVEV